MASKRKLQAEATKAKLLKKSMELMEERDFDEITIEDITSACGVAKGTFYLYFKSKNDLLNIIETYPYNDAAEAIAEGHYETAKEKVCAYVIKWVELLKRYSKQFSRRWIWHVSSDAYAREHENSKIRYDRDTILGYLKEGQESGEIAADAPVVNLADAITSCLYGTTLYSIVPSDDLDLDTWKHTMADKIVPLLIDPYLTK